MIIVDANILFYAEDSLSPKHERSREWWDAQLSDAYLAALAVENNCTLYSTDADFSRFKALEWKNPLT